jgi:hypothetical protein
MLLKISTAQTVVIGPILDADGAAVTTAIVTNISLAKNGSAAALTTETLTHLANGYYTLALTSGNTNTLGSLEVFANNTAMSMTVFRYNVIAAQVYDSIVSGTDLLQIDIQQLVGSAQDAARILIGANSNHEVQVTGSNHVAADIHELQAGVITAADFAAGAITSTVLATDSITSSQIAASAVTELQSGLATSNGVTAAFTEIKGAGWSSGTDTLEKIADAAGPGVVNVAPYSSTIPQRVIGTRIDMFFKEAVSVTIAVFNSSGVAVDLTAQGSLRVCIERRDGTDLQTIENANITISGGSNNQATWTCNATATGTLGQHYWSLRRVTNDEVLAHGEWRVSPAAFDN